MMSGGPVQKFTRGWAVLVKFSKSPQAAHYYVRDGVALVSSLCGRQTDIPATALRGLGSWKKCKNCERLEAAQ